MVNRDILLAKCATIDRCLARIREVREPHRAALSPVDIEDITVLNLQRAAQAAIDLAAHVVVAEAYGLPDSLAAAFSQLERQGVIDAELAARLRKMVGFRNIAVHDYQSIDPAILEAIVTRHLGDLEAFAARMLSRFAAEASGSAR
jgi:uncharacterized protein YutE (UPF0331/DUF86 family)